MDNTDDLKKQIEARDETIAKLRQQLDQQQTVIAAIQKQSRIWLLPWTMSPQEVAGFAENSRRTFGGHCLIIPSSCVKAPQLMEIKRADEDEVREAIKDADKCYNAIIANAQKQAQSYNQQQKLKRLMQQVQAQPVQRQRFDGGAIEIPAMKDKAGNVFSLPTFDKKKRAFVLPNGSAPGREN